MTYFSKAFSATYWTTVSQFAEGVNGVRDLFAAVGLTQTADTGQLGDPSLLGSLPLNSSLGYNVYSWDDGISTLYMKWEYINGSSLGGQNYFRVNIGTGTDGAGTITGLLFGPLTTSGNVSNYTPLQENFISRVGSALTIAIQGSVNYYHFLYIDRQRNQVTGEPILDSYSFAYSTTNQGSSIKCISPSEPWSITIDYGASSAKVPAHPLGHTFNSGTSMPLEQAKVDLVPIFGYFRQGLFILPGIMTYSTYDIPANTRMEFDAVVFGQTRHYKAISTKLFASNATALWGWAMLWE